MAADHPHLVLAGLTLPFVIVGHLSTLKVNARIQLGKQPCKVVEHTWAARLGCIVATRLRELTDGQHAHVRRSGPHRCTTFGIEAQVLARTPYGVTGNTRPGTWCSRRACFGAQSCYSQPVRLTYRLCTRQLVPETALPRSSAECVVFARGVLGECSTAWRCMSVAPYSDCARIWTT